VIEYSHTDNVGNIKKIGKAQSVAGVNVRFFHSRFLIESISFISLSNSDPKNADFAGQEREERRKEGRKRKTRNRMKKTAAGKRRR
jgi:hypothetical protein